MSITSKQQDKVVRFYKRDKLSMMQIADKLDINLKTVQYHLNKRGIKRRSLSEAITAINISKFNKIPFELKRTLSSSDKELKIAGIMLYWGEGTKRGEGNKIAFTNSDPDMIKLFLSFLRKICGIHEDRLKALLHMYDDQDRENLESFWVKVTGITKNRFYKTYVHKGKTGSYKKKSEYGTIAINYSDKLLLKQMLEWIEEYQVKLI